MTLVNPSLLSAVGKGFLGDDYAVDGNHLRWQFDDRLGFPRFAFCVDQRPSVVTGRRSPAGGERFADLRLPAGGTPQTLTRFTVGPFQVRRTAVPFVRTVNGVTLDGQPITLQFTEADGHACWVRLRFTIMSRLGSAAVDALYDNRGQLEVVDRATKRQGRPFPPLDDIVVLPDRLDPLRARLADLLDHPPSMRRPPLIADPKLLPIHRRLMAIDPQRFSRVSVPWLRDVLGLLAELDLRPDQLAPDLAVPVQVVLEVSSARIDQLSVTGSSATLHDVRWVRSESLAADGGWKPVDCYQAATDEADYVERNKDLFAGQGALDIAKERIVNGGPVGVEPLDEPLVPPSRPATDDEKLRRYFEPWEQRLEPWLELVLAQSLGGGVHQSEVTITADLDDAGQHRGAGIPSRLVARPPRMTMRPYPILIAAALTGFQTARLMGLGCVHAQVGSDRLDYRVRGRWLVEDLWAWVGAEVRRYADLVKRAAHASPADHARLQSEVVAAQLRLIESATFTSQLVAGATDGIVDLVALMIGVAPAGHPPFSGPTNVTVSDDGLGIPPPHAHQALAAVEWSLRQRARVIDDTLVPTGACIARAPGASVGIFESVRNPNDPADDTSPPVAILPAGPPGAPGSAGTARFVDRYVDDGVAYRYGVSECDPFGRWSRFTETTFTWDDLTPPAPPVQVTATLDESGSPARQVLTTSFAWPEIAGAPAAMMFELNLRRVPPLPGNPADPLDWGMFERSAGTAAGVFAFGGAVSGASTHDGMAMSVSFVDQLRPGLSGSVSYRVFTVIADGVVVPFDADDRARAWVAVGTRNAKGIASDSLGGPALAEDFRVAPPAPPVFPSEPLNATFPDADRISTFTMTWSAGPRVRSTVYRAGERDLAAMAEQRGIASTWIESDPPALRSAAVRAIAPSLRDAFKPVSGVLTPGTSSYTDQLPGELSTLSLYTVVRQSPALVPGPWPTAADGFVAVAVPKIPEPSLPLVIRAAYSLDDGGGVDLSIAEPSRGSAPVGSYEVFRVFEENVARSSDWRTMRPCGRFDVSATSYVERPSGPPKMATIRDADALTAWRSYLYRVVARSAVAGRQTRSAPSAVVRVRSLDPDPPGPPTIQSATQTAAGLEVTWTATAPVNQVGRFRFTIADPSGPITLRTVDDDDPGLRDPADPTRFSLILVAVAPTEITLTITDPVGRSTTGPAATVT